VEGGNAVLIASDSRQKMIGFADNYFGEYVLKESPSGDKLIPKLCPLCHGGSSGKDKNTFALFLENGMFVCKRGSCGRHGRFEDLVKELSGEDVKLARSASSSKKSEKQYVLPNTITDAPTEEIYQYFEKRGISRSTVDAFKIASDMDGNIVFQFFLDGVDVYEKYRKPHKPVTPEEHKRKEWQFSGAKPILYNMDNVVFNQPLIITEGQCDAMALYEAGLTNVVSVPSGCDNLEFVSLCWDWLEKFKTIILFGDNDPPGKKMVETLIKKLGEYRVLVVRDYPEIKDSNPKAYCKDANEILLRYGESMLLEMVDNAEEIETKGLMRLADVIPYDPTKIPRIRTMIPALDETIGGLAEGGVTVLTGASGNGKSTLSGQLILCAIQQGYNCCAYSGELPAQNFQEWFHLQAAGSEWITLKQDPVRGKPVPYVPNEVAQRIIKWYEPHMFMYNNDEVFIDVKQADAIVSVFTTAARKDDCKLFLVDNLMTTTADSEEEFRAQAQFVNSMKQFAKRYQAHVLIVAHARKVKTGDHIQKSDVSGSSAIINLADCAIVSERPDLRIIKNRGYGQERTIVCAYCGDSRRIYQADVGDKCYFGWDRTGLTKPSVRADSMPEYGIQLAQQGSQPF
jgi:twinkle protein